MDQKKSILGYENPFDLNSPNTTIQLKNQPEILINCVLFNTMNQPNESASLLTLIPLRQNKQNYHDSTQNSITNDLDGK